MVVVRRGPFTPLFGQFERFVANWQAKVQAA